MKISLITVSFNSSSSIKDTFESVLSQTYSDIEYIVVDGQSTDNTIDIIKEFEPKFNGRMRWISEPDNGLYDAMNKGIKMATGDIVGILNSDDFYTHENVISNVISCFEAENVQSVYANLYFVDYNNTNKIVRRWQSSPYKEGSFRKGWHPPHPTFFAKKECYDNYGLFDIELPVSADFELMLRFIEKEKISTYFMNDFIIAMRHGGESTGSIKKIIEGNKNVLKAFKKNNIHAPFYYVLLRLLPKVKNKFCHILKK